METQICITCNKEFIPKCKGTKNCSKSCAAIYNHKNKKKETPEKYNIEKTYICEYKPCSKEFKSKRKNARFCSKSCQGFFLNNNKDYKNKISKSLKEYCNTELGKKNIIKAAIASNTERLKKQKAISTVKTTTNKYGVPCGLMLGKNHTTISNINLKFKEELEKLTNKEIKLEKTIYGKSFDLYYNNLLIEINPSISHNSTIHFRHLTRRCKVKNCKEHIPIANDYHYNKWKIAKDNGYELISIFDWYDKDKILSFLASKINSKNNINIGARKTIINNVDKKDAKIFFEKNHIMGYDNSSSQQIFIGLYYKNLLVSCMSFSKPRYNKKYDFELLRFANDSKYNIIGSASKMFNYFINNYKPKNVITYSNNDFGNGNVYKILGFKEEKIIKGSCMFVDLKNNKFVKYLSLIRLGADRLLPRIVKNYFHVGLDREDFIKRGGDKEYHREFKQNKNINWWPGNLDIIRHYGFVEVYDSGSTFWRFNNDTKL